MPICCFSPSSLFGFPSFLGIFFLKGISGEERERKAFKSLSAAEEKVPL